MKCAVRTAMWTHRCAMNIREKSPFLSSAKRGFPFVLSSSCISQEKLVIHLPYFTALSFTEMWEVSWTCAVESRLTPFPIYQSLREEVIQACCTGSMGWAFQLLTLPVHLQCALGTRPISSFTMYSTDRTLKTLCRPSTSL